MTSRSICVIGSGPIVIGQACEFDYAGCQALKVLREDGFRTIVVNSNPATIMTDPGFADRTYVEPLDLEGVAGVLARERPDALLPTLGGQTALNLALELAEAGVLDELGVELIGAGVDVIRARRGPRALPRDGAARGLPRAGLDVVTSWEDVPPELTFPRRARPAFTLGGHGGGTARHRRRARRAARARPAESPVGQVLVEESLIGWDEFELEVMRDRNDNVVDRLLDREPRPDGRPHRRLGDGRAADDALRRGLPGAARRRRSRSSAPSASRRAARTSSSRASARPASCG